MGVTVDLEQLARIFGRRGERVVLVLPQGEPVVLVPLSEYEQLTLGAKGSKPIPMAVPANPQGRRGPGRPPVVRPSGDSLEQIDPLQGQLTDDDAYFPEPLE